jgi:hypothetical protein
MNRREFLKLGGALSAMLVLPLGSLGKEVASLATIALQGLTYRGTLDGKVYVSANGGKTWKLHTDFGPAFTIFSLTLVPRNRIYARIGFAGKSFGLVLSPAEHVWRTT